MSESSTAKLEAQMLVEKLGAFDAKLAESCFALGTLQVGINQLVETDSARREEMELVADLRSKVAEGLTILHEQMVHIEKGVMLLRTPHATPAPTRGGKLWRVFPWAGGFLAGAMVVGVVWWAGAETAYKAFAVDLNSVVQQVYTQLPKSAQEQLRVVYRQHNFVAPSQR